MKAWWHSGIYKNKNDSNEPLALVYFLDNQSGDFQRKSIPITQLGRYHIGSAWEGQKQVGALKFEVRSFEVSFDKGSFFFNRCSDPRVPGCPPYPNEIHPFWNGKNNSWLIEFPLSSGGTLTIPCLEVLSRLYGRSQEIKRIIASKPWSKCLSRLVLETDDIETSGFWTMRKPHWATNGDIPLLAHLKYSRYARSSVRSIYAQIESGFTPGSKAPIFIKVRPWFEGPATIKVAGISFNHGKSFLGLQILGCSDPQCPPIEVLTNDTTSRHKAPIRIDKAEAITDKTEAIFTAETSPDRGSREHISFEPPFEQLGAPCKILKRPLGQRDREQVAIRADQIEELDSVTASADDPFGTQKRVIKSLVQAPTPEEIETTIQKVWGTLKHIEQLRAGITSVQAAAYDKGRIQWSDELKLLSFKPSSHSSSSWPYRSASRKRPRRFLLCKISYGPKTFFLLEVERRPRSSSISGEENYQGLVFVTDQAIEHTLTKVVSAIAKHQGIMKKAVNELRLVANTFTHRESDGDGAVYQTAIFNTLVSLRYK